MNLVKMTMLSFETIIENAIGIFMMISAGPYQ